MLCLLHGYQLEGSGSNLWTRSVLETLCREGKEIHLVCQEAHPDRYDFIAQAFEYDEEDTQKELFSRKVEYPGKVICHRPNIGPFLPVYVSQEGATRWIKMTDLSEEQLAEYLLRNTRVVVQIVKRFGITFLHANHVVLMAVVAQWVSEQSGVNYAVMPHGSAIEYVVRQDERLRKLALEALRKALRVYVITDEIQVRVKAVFPELTNLEAKTERVGIGVDICQFRPVKLGGRAKLLDRIEENIKNLPVGKNDALKEKLVQNISAEIDKAQYREMLKECSQYNQKSPDEGVVNRLRAIDWEKEKTALFVGKFLSAKGFQAILVALPNILERVPNLRLVVVGNGPLREVFEAMLFAMRKGDAQLLDKLVTWGSLFEDEKGQSYFKGVQNYIGRLKEANQLEGFLERAKKYLKSDTVVFTGYLNHRELALLYPLCEVAIFPSIVKEAGPMVLVEAMACSCFPVGTNHGGIAYRLGWASQGMKREEAEWMVLDPDPELMIIDLVDKLPGAFKVANVYRDYFRELAVRDYDWAIVARPLLNRS